MSNKSHKKTEPSSIVTASTSSLMGAAPTAQRSRKAAAMARPDGTSKTVQSKKQKEIKQKDVREESTTDRKELLLQAPKLEALVRVATQAVENLRERKEVAKTAEPPVKRQQLAKGRSAVMGKGKASVSKLAEATTTSIPDSAAPLPPIVESRESSSLRPVMAVTPKTVSSQEGQQSAADEPEIERSVSQLNIDLAISADSSGAENFADSYIIGEEDSLSDVEPDSPSKVSKQHLEEKPVLTTTVIPKIVADFQDSITISDDG